MPGDHGLGRLLRATRAWHNHGVKLDQGSIVTGKYRLDREAMARWAAIDAGIGKASKPAPTAPPRQTPIPSALTR
jgi:hypothetical protein